MFVIHFYEKETGRWIEDEIFRSSSFKGAVTWAEQLLYSFCFDQGIIARYEIERM